METYNLELFADYHQIYLQDENAEGDLSESWTEEAVQNMIALAPGTIGVGTVRNNTVPICVEVVENKPEDNYDEWDKVNECSIDLPSGKMVVSGCMDYFPEARRIIVKPGIYRVRVYYKNLNKISEDGLTGEDFYKLVLWLDTEQQGLKILKK